MLKIAICPHITPEKFKLFWQNFGKKLENLLGESVEFHPFFSFEEEKEKINIDDFDIYYANPESIPLLYKKGYKPIAKFKNQKDIFYVIAKNELNKRKIKVATPFSSIPIYGIIGFEFEDIEVIFTKNWIEVFEFVKDGKADAGIMYNEIWEEIESKEDIKILKKTDFEVFHLFMVKPQIYKKLQNALLTFDFLEKADEKDVFKILSVFDLLNLFAKKWEEHDIAKALMNIDNVGVIIYQNKIVYVNDYVCKLLNYSKEELFSKSPLDLIDEKSKEKIKHIIEKRLNGEKLDISFNEVYCKSKEGKTFIVNVFSTTILYKGRYSGFVIFFDVTKQKKYERMYNLLREVNQAITLSSFEEEMFEKIGNALVNKIGLSFVWVGEKDNNSPYFKILYKFGDDKGYLDEIKVSYKKELSTGNGPTGRAFREEKIIIVSDTQSDPFFLPWREAANKRNFLSVAAIPLKDKNGKIKYVITMYAKEREFFDEEIINLLNELKSDMEFAIKRFQEMEMHLIISKAMENSHSWVVITDENFNIIYVNNTVCKISGYSKEELIGKNPRIFKSGLVSDKIYEKIYETLLSGKEYSGILINKKKNGEIFYLKTTIYPIEVASKKRFVSIGTDITKEIMLKNEIDKIKNYDVLTGLLNKEGFWVVVSEELKKMKCYALLALIDIRNFTFINKNYGFIIGDFILKELANRFKNYFDDGIISRISSDEFAIFIQIDEMKEGLIILMDTLNEIFSIPFYIEDKEINLAFNAGIAVAPRDGNEIEVLFENASLALSIAKEDKENSIIIFDKDLEEKLEHISFAKKLIEKAIKENLFTLYYQPLFNAKTLKLEGFEALVRIKDKDKIYPPSVFIDILEESKYLEDYEKWLLSEIQKKANEWKVPISFNTSANSFKNEEYIKYLSSLRLDISLVMEITERVLMQDIEKTKKILNTIKKTTALKIAMDDFGTEYSSLKYLKDLPVDEIKIDISFTREMIKDEKTKALVETIIMLAKKLGMKTLAEGIENNEQMELLKKWGCDYLQGFLFGKPMPEDEANKLVAKYYS